MILVINKHSSSNLITNSSTIIFPIETNESVDDIWKSLCILINTYNKNEKYNKYKVSSKHFEKPILVTEEMYKEFSLEGEFFNNSEFDVTEDLVGKVVIYNKDYSFIPEHFQWVMMKFFGTEIRRG